MVFGDRVVVCGGRAVVLGGPGHGFGWSCRGFGWPGHPSLWVGRAVVLCGPGHDDVTKKCAEPSLGGLTYPRYCAKNSESCG